MKGLDALLEAKKSGLKSRLAIVRIAHGNKPKKVSAVMKEFATVALGEIVEASGSEGINFTENFDLVLKHRDFFEHILHWDGDNKFAPSAFDVLWNVPGIASVKLTKGSNEVRVNRSKEECIKGDSRTVFWLMADKVEEFLNKNDLIIGA